MSTFKTPKGTELPLLNLRGKPYLQVAHRIVWFCEEHPTWRIITEPERIGDDFAIFRAKILNDDGEVVRVAHKTETEKGFSDFVEKAETGAIGRALALIGYGTQFTDDLDEGTRLADAPVAHVKKPSVVIGGTLPLTRTTGDEIRELVKKKNVLPEQLTVMMQGKKKEEMTEGDGKRLIAALEQLK